MKDLILFVEDNEDLRESAAGLLALNNYEVLVASNGKEALEKISTAARLPDLIISDISMPLMDGYEFFDKVRHRQGLGGVPFIFLTALGTRADMRLGWETGVDDYLVKPFQPEDFLIKVKSRLKRSREIRQAVSTEFSQAREALVQILSHQIRTPLTYVTGGFTLLLDELNKQPIENGYNGEVQTFLDLINKGTEILRRIAYQTVTFAELASGKTYHDIAQLGKPTALQVVFREALASVEMYRVDYNSEIQIGTIVNGWVLGIKEILVDAFKEMLINAIIYSPPRSVVYVDSVQQNDTVMIKIRNMGEFIPPETLEHIWEPIVQTQKDPNAKKGIGLGLPIVKRVIDVHKGIVDITSDIKAGTTVTVQLTLVHPL